MTQSAAFCPSQQLLASIECNLPSRTDQLLTLYQTSSQHHQRICAMAKIKSQIVSALTQLAYTPPSFQTSQAVELLFYNAVLRFVKRWRGRSEEQLVEARLFSHVAGLAIKYYFREQAFKCLIGQMTELLDGHIQRIRPVLSLFSQIIAAIEYSERDILTNRFRCLFQRHFTGQHLNSMLILANFCIQKGLIRDGHVIEELIADEGFQIRAPEETLLAAFKLLRAILCFDWLGQKFNNFEQISQSSSIVIPTKGTKQSALTQFQKWLKNCQWVRLYQNLLLKCRSTQLKLQVAELIGDMSRIHMKFFKNKNNFKMHIENLTYSFCTVISELELNRNSEGSIALGIALARNLNKLITTGVGSILFEINTNFFRGLLQNIKKLIVEQIIAEQIFNSNLLLYLFHFIEGLLIKSRFQKTLDKFLEIEEKVREICRNYEHYIRILFHRIIKNPHRKSQPSYYRMDCARLKESIKIYETKELGVYFLPFRMMKPRYASTNCVQELFVYVTARIMRALGLLEYFKLVQWERELSYEIIVQSLQKIAEWFSFTSYRKHHQGQTSNSKQLSDLPIIRQMYEEQIQNQEEYCHYLRLIIFIAIQEFVEQKPTFFSTLAGPLLKMIGLTLQLCFGADLQQIENKQIKEESMRLRIQTQLQMCEQLCLKTLLKQYQAVLFHHNSTHRPFNNYQYVHPTSQLAIINDYMAQKNQLLQIILQYYSGPFDKLDKRSLVKLLFLLYCSCLSDEADKKMNFDFTLKEYCIIAEYMATTPVLLALCKSEQPKIATFIKHMLRFLGENAHNPTELSHYLACLRHVGCMNIEDFSQEALNKLFVSLNYFMPFLADAVALAQQLSQQLQIISEKLLIVSRENDFVELGQELLRILAKNRTQIQNLDVQSTFVSLPEFQQPTQQLSPPQNEKQIQSPTKNTTTQHNPAEQIQEAELCKFELEEVQAANLEHNQERKQESSSLHLQNGYHRLKTLQLLDRYAQPQPETLNNQQQRVQTNQDQAVCGSQGEMSDHHSNSIQKASPKLIPMQIQQQMIDMRECVNQIFHKESQGQHIINHLAENIERHEEQQLMEDLIPFATDEELDKPNDPLAEFKDIQYIKADDFSETTERNTVDLQTAEKTADIAESHEPHENNQKETTMQTILSNPQVGNQEPEQPINLSDESPYIIDQAICQALEKSGQESKESEQRAELKDTGSEQLSNCAQQREGQKPNVS